MRFLVLLLAAAVLITSLPCHISSGVALPMKAGVVLAALNVCGGAADSSSVTPDAASIPEQTEAGPAVLHCDLADKPDPRPASYILPRLNERPPEA